MYVTGYTSRRAIIMWKLCRGCLVRRSILAQSALLSNAVHLPKHVRLCCCNVTLPPATFTCDIVYVLVQMGLGIAAEYVLQIGIEAIWDRVQQLAGLLRQQLSSVKGVTVQDRGRLLCGIVSFTMVGQQPSSANVLSCDHMSFAYIAKAFYMCCWHVLLTAVISQIGQ